MDGPGALLEAIKGVTLNELPLTQGKTMVIRVHGEPGTGPIGVPAKGCVGLDLTVGKRVNIIQSVVLNQSYFFPLTG